ncbi:methyl-accepting chemotaxis protein [Caulobacter sp. LARHSG274]
MNFDNLRLRTKTLVPLIGMALVFALVVAGGVFKLSELSHRYAQITDGVDPAILRLAGVARFTNSLGRNAYQSMNYDPASPRGKQVMAEFHEVRTLAAEAFDDAIRLNPAKAEQYRAFKARFDRVYEAAQKPVAIGSTFPSLTDIKSFTPENLDQLAAAASAMAAVDVEITALAADIKTFNTALERENGVTVAALKQDAAKTTIMMVVFGLASILTGLGVSVWIANAKIAAPLVRLGERMKRLAQGDLTVDVEGQERGDEVGAMAKAVQVFKDNALKGQAMEDEARRLREEAEAQRQAAEQERAARAAELARVVEALAGGLQRLADGVLTHRLEEPFGRDYEQLRGDFNAAIDKLQSALGAVVSSARSIKSGSSEISQAADSLSRRTEQQAASLEETAAALDEITATVRKTAEGARDVRRVVGRAKEDAEASGKIVEQAVDAMSAIERSSGEINQIIGVIDEIAFQTNLLALNAGVEAARAGDAGRGFAVVASEVRALAQRSAEAAKEIKALIATSTSEVGQGVELVGQTGKALRRIADHVSEISGVVEAISHSTEEQATGLAQVNTAINQMDQATQQNAAMVEESTAASHGLSQEAVTLTDLMLGFQVGAPKRAADGVQPIRSAQERIAKFATS